MSRGDGFSTSTRAALPGSPADARSALHAGEHDRARLASRLALAVRRARRSGGAGARDDLAARSPTMSIPSAVVCASRRAGEPWFVFEQPERGARGAGGAGRGDEPARAAVRRASRASPSAGGRCPRRRSPIPSRSPPAAGPVAVGGFAFAPDGGGAPHWQGFEPASLTVPEVALARLQRGGESIVRLTLAALARPDDVPEELLARLQQRLAELRGALAAAARPGADRALSGRPARCRPSTTSRPSRAPSS